MILVAITLGFVLVGLASFVYGAIALSKYGFRISTTQGLAVLLVPPYTFYFAFFVLDEEDKVLPTTGWLFGVFVTILLSVIFFPTLKLVAQGRFSTLRKRASAQANPSQSEDEEDEEDEESASDDSESTDDSDDQEGSTETSGTSNGDAGSTSETDAGASSDGG